MKQPLSCQAVMNSVLCTGSLELERSKHSEVLLQYLSTGSSADVRWVKAKEACKPYLLIALDAALPLPTHKH